MLKPPEIEAIDQAGMTPALRDELVRQSDGSLWLAVYRVFSAPWWITGLAALALLVNIQTRDLIHPGLLMAGMITVPMALVSGFLMLASWSPDPAVRLRHRLVALSIHTARGWAGAKARLDLEELAQYLDGVENAETALVVLAPYRRKRRYYRATVAMGLGLFAITIGFFTMGLPLMLGAS